MRKAVATNRASAGDGPYSQAIVMGGFLFVSGQGPLDGDGNVVGETIEEQAQVTMNNLKVIVEAGGCTMDDVCKVGVFLTDMRHFARFNAVYETYFNAPLPARTCVECGLDGILVEIDAIAGIPADARGKGDVQ